MVDTGSWPNAWDFSYRSCLDPRWLYGRLGVAQSLCDSGLPTCLLPGVEHSSVHHIEFLIKNFNKKASGRRPASLGLDTPIELTLKPNFEGGRVFSIRYTPSWMPVYSAGLSVNVRTIQLIGNTTMVLRHRGPTLPMSAGVHNLFTIFPVSPAILLSMMAQSGLELEHGLRISLVRPLRRIQPLSIYFPNISTVPSGKAS
jgi:hypothetical protein